MRKSVFVPIALLASLFVMSFAQDKGEIIWIPKERLKIDKPKYSSDKNCKLAIQRDGVFVVMRKIDGKYKVSWRSEMPKVGGDNFFVSFQDDAQLVVYKVVDGRSNEAVWASGFREDPDTVPSDDDFVRAVRIDKECRLYIEPADGDAFGWRNIWTDFYSGTSYLNKGNMLYDDSSGVGLTMHLQQDCNLVIFEGKDLADRKTIYWTSKTSSSEDCYVYASSELLGLFKGKNKYYTSGDESKPYDKHLWLKNFEGDMYDYVSLTKNGPQLVGFSDMTELRST